MHGMHEFNGFTDTKISRMEGTNKWKMELLSDPSMYVMTRANDIPLGKYTFRRDVINSSSTLTVNLSTCDPDMEYNCKDGPCIFIVER
jgi:hypothetical protein